MPANKEKIGYLFTKILPELNKKLIITRYDDFINKKYQGSQHIKQHILPLTALFLMFICNPD